MRALLVFLAVGAGPAASLACPAENTILACDLSGGRALEVCLSGMEVSYRFGPPDKPELHLTTSLIRADYTPWPGVGRAIFESLVFDNQGWRYEPFFVIDRLAANPQLEGGVSVLRDNELVTQVLCQPGTVTENFDRLGAALEDLGLCWNRPIHAWATRCED